MKLRLALNVFTLKNKVVQLSQLHRGVNIKITAVNIGGIMLVPEYFPDNELACPCGCGTMPDERSVGMIYSFRIIVNEPVILNSAGRCKAYNARRGWAEESAHLIGAFDVKTTREKEFKYIKVAQAVGFTALGINNNTFMHMDRHHVNPDIWTY